MVSGTVQKDRTPFSRIIEMSARERGALLRDLSTIERLLGFPDQTRGGLIDRQLQPG